MESLQKVLSKHHPGKPKIMRPAEPLRPISIHLERRVKKSELTKGWQNMGSRLWLFCL